jgi:hypothetical protein
LPQKRILQPMQVAPERRDSRETEEFGQVLRFPRRGAGQQRRPGRAGEAEPADDLARYEQDQDEPVDYRRRMRMNVIAVAIVTLLICAGVWIADTIADMQKDQDCIMQGRANCAPLEIAAPRLGNSPRR